MVVLIPRPTRQATQARSTAAEAEAVMPQARLTVRALRAPRV
jgi:hypothetical protein